MIVVLTYFILILLALIGWVMNLIDVVGLALSNNPLTTLFIVKLIGVPVGFIGAILGWF